VSARSFHNLSLPGAKEYAMAVVFPSQPWAEQLQQALTESATYQSAAQSWEGDLLLVIEDAGVPRRGLYLDVWHGVCREATYVADLQGRRAAYTISATLATWHKVLSGELDPMPGMMTRQLRVEGNLVKLIQYMQAAHELIRCATQIEIAE